MKKTLFFFLVVFSGILLHAQTIIVNTNITSNTNWNSTNIDTVRITADISLQAGVTLTITGGVAVVFDQLKTLTVNGTLNATGLPGDSVVFTVIDTTGFKNIRSNAYGGWGGIRASNAQLNLDHCIFEYAKWANPADTDSWGDLNMGTAYRAGGAVYANNTPVNMTNCCLRNNYAYGGSAMQCETGSKVTFTNCKIYNNTSWLMGTVSIISPGIKKVMVKHCEFLQNISLGGGGLFLRLGDSVFVDSCKFTGNLARRPYSFQSIPGGGINGGAVYCQGFDFTNTLRIKIRNCEILNNEADNSGGGLYFTGNAIAEVLYNTISYNLADMNVGGGIDINTSGNYYTTDINIAWNKITNNNADYGGGIYYYNVASPILHLNIINNLIANNTSEYSSPGAYGGGGGGGINLTAGNDTVKILNNTIVNNFSEFMAGGIYIRYSTGSNIISGNLIWGNKAANAYINFRSPQIGYFGDTNTTILDPLKFNIIQGGVDSIGIVDYMTYKNFNSVNYPAVYANNLSVNPEMFAPTTNSGTSGNALTADFSLKSWSPAINFGNPLTQITDPYMSVDLAMNPRIFTGLTPIIDIGCYEYQGEPTTVSLPDNQNDELLRIYPNPVNQTLFFNIPQYKEISVYDINGKKLISRPYENATLDVSSLMPGLYLIRIYIGENYLSARFIKN